MFVELENLPNGILGFEARGKFTAADYENVLIPATERALKNEPLKLVFIMPEGFHGMELGALRDDLAFGIKHHADIRKFAFVTDDHAMAALTRAFSFMIPAETRVFSLGEREAAISWLAA